MKSILVFLSLIFFAKCYNQDVTGKIIGSVIGGTVVIILACSFYCYRKCKAIRLSKQLQERYNTVVKSMTNRQFMQKAATIINLIKEPNTFKYYIQDNMISISDVKCEPIKKSPYIYKISISGAQPLGKWNGEGYLMCKQHAKLFIWFQKFYSNKRKAGQIGQKKHLIF